ncbi:unnamed protein product [Fusarium graminearum]|uniref:Chromosome 4, complete genome n=2 Tax=Gibberella zeae TaxID=5518 RepID=A0A0E0SD38_GIBZE|nr:hypothetical protein FG05_30282 [Fusarium graminearum]CAF3473611.1 unnamed protein product [Fusarium graminearum]CAF3508855.1 unnamed protein product [Fusarium graminearum]CAG1988529.1 unnamed protein product [Fusarium graminearum]CAG1996541.1 unnamed protein product [Fusarium graminearum]
MSGGSIDLTSVTIRSDLRPINGDLVFAMLWLLGQVQAAYNARKGISNDGPSGASSLCIRAPKHCSPG